MVDMQQYWPVVLLLGAGVFILRFSFILIMDRITMPESVTRMLRFIPASVLPALVVPAVLLQHEAGAVSYAGIEKSVAALIAVLVAWKTRNVLATIAGGMVVLWGMQAVL